METMSLSICQGLLEGVNIPFHITIKLCAAGGPSRLKVLSRFANSVRDMRDLASMRCWYIEK